MKWYHFLLIILGILIIPPIIYNFVLLLEVPLDISIIDTGAPAVWLSFGGSMVAACASFVMAYIAYAQNKEIRDQNTAKVEYETALKQYEQLEKFVLDTERLLSYNTFEVICSYDSREECGSSFLKAYYEYKIELNYISALSIEFFMDKSGEGEQYYNIISPLYTEALRLLDILGDLKNVTDTNYLEYLDTLGNQGGKSDREKFLGYTMETITLIAEKELHELGFKYLRTKWGEVLNKLETIKK